jgi:hypothetical protein
MHMRGCGVVDPKPNQSLSVRAVSLRTDVDSRALEGLSLQIEGVAEPEGLAWTGGVD